MKPGRPPLMGETLQRVLVTLDAETIRKARAAGRGNLSAGIRARFRRARRAPPAAVES